MQAFVFCVARNKRRNKRSLKGATTMDWLQFLSSIISSIAWPTAVVGLACIMRDPLAKLMLLIRRLKYKEFQIDIGEQLEAVRDQVGAEGEAPNLPVEEPPLSFKSLAQADPRAAVLSAWIPVETELRDIAMKMGISGKPATMLLIRELYKAGVVDRVTFDTLEKLRRIRNSAVHVTESDVTFEDAINMADMCQWVTGHLKRNNANPNLPADLS
ncbi:DUF4145 domain-containing protein [Pseudomonas lactis]|uniref:DUF4145 domain-containing protein n=2 Tax=Pseudomonas TaxID=286 RepID=A0ABS9FHP3_9PSED|nr:DUF4145 domain-containing protein [Pseudomonas lactis]MCF5369944.1 DUF4145 domain-containing protein [Pseudomonas sp. PA-4-8C]MCF4999425.1 DUF4145 domain-containing protein [Pseudomonas lactis]MCF5010126.1 DUF4145 domain-containing protein [Pseudomonas lactis]MCF5012768.1 DUF4145 domain-containing protein [Pseudomonas lactis]